MLTRDDLINHIIFMKLKDEDYARAALRHYNELLPHFDLNAGVKEAMKGQK